MFQDCGLLEGFASFIVMKIFGEKKPKPVFSSVITLFIIIQWKGQNNPDYMFSFLSLNRLASSMKLD